jgi:putative effector of murein hydrolase
MLTATVTANVAKLAMTNPSALPISNFLGGGGAITAVYGASSSCSELNSSIESAGIS